MKKLYTFIIAMAISGLTTAATIDVSIIDNQFNPPSFTAEVGDVVRWTNNGAMSHTTTSTSVPSGAAAWNSTLAPSQTFSYTITTEGSYSYQCNFHAGMVGGFTATPAVGIKELNVNVSSVAYPNPFKNKVSISFANIEKIVVFNITGKAIKSVELSKSDSKIEFDLTDLASGVYFYNLISEGRVAETRKIVKTQ